MGRFSKKILFIGLSLSTLISSAIFAKEIDVEDSIEAALVTVIVKSDSLDTFCAERKCSKKSSLFAEDETGNKSLVPGLVQVTYHKSFGYEPAPEEMISAVSRLELDANAPDISSFAGAGQGEGMLYTDIPPEAVDIFCSANRCFYIGPVSSRIVPPLYLQQWEEYVIVGYWHEAGPLPRDPTPPGE